MTEFRSNDLHFCALLVVAGVKMLRMERPSATKRRVDVVFEDDGSTIATLRAGWIDGSATVAVRAYAEALQSLHARIALV